MFQHRLAALLGWSVRKLETEMGAGEYARWWRFWQSEPWGPTRDNMHAGMIAAAVVNSRANRPRNGKLATFKDFMLKTAGQARRSSLGKALSFFRAVGRRKGAGNDAA